MVSVTAVRRRLGIGVSLALVMSLTLGGVAFADNVQNDVTAQPPNDGTIIAGGSTTVGYRIAANNGDSETGCNAKAGSPAVVTPTLPTGVTASPASLSFTACGSFQYVVFTSSTVGNHVIPVAVSDGGPGTYNLNPATFTLRVLAPSDTTAPVITPTVTGTMGGGGWYTSDVSVSWSVTDPESTFTSSGCGTSTVSNDTSGVTFSCSATSTGGTSSQSVTIKRDTTAPAVTATAAPTAASNGWNRTPVTVTFTGSDVGGSGVASCDAPVSLNGDGSNQSATGSCSDVAGNGASVTVSGVAIDATSPSVTATVTPAPNDAGWNRTPVTVTFSGTDEVSGIASCDSTVTVPTEGSGQSTTGSCSDVAGNVGSLTVSDIDIDLTAPTVTASVSSTGNARGWSNAPVTVTFDGTDALSGIAACDDLTVLGEGANQTATGSCTDVADNTGSATSTEVDIDLTAPEVTASVSSTGNARGWSNAPVTVTFDGSDALSGIADCDDPTVLGEGADQTATGSCTDVADNTGSATSAEVDIDLTAPVVAVTGVTEGASYVLGSLPAAGCSTSDALSGVDTSASTSVSGGVSPGVGSFTATCSGASDVAGNQGSATVSYSVTFQFTGFFSPVDNLPTVNSAKAGSAIPMKFKLGGNQGLGVVATGYPRSVATSCDATLPVDAIEETVTAGGSSLTYDTTAGQYIYVWKTDKAHAGSCRQFQLKLIDGTVHTAMFKFTK